MQRTNRPCDKHMAKAYEYGTTPRGTRSFNRGGNNSNSDEHFCSASEHATAWQRGRIIGACLGVVLGCAVARAVSEMF